MIVIGTSCSVCCISLSVKLVTHGKNNWNVSDYCKKLISQWNFLYVTWLLSLHKNIWIRYCQSIFKWNFTGILVLHDKSINIIEILSENFIKSQTLFQLANIICVFSLFFLYFVVKPISFRILKLNDKKIRKKIIIKRVSNKIWKPFHD